MENSLRRTALKAMYDWRMAKLFISHAAQDKTLVEAVVDLLEGGVGIPHKSIFCSSLKGQNIKPGEDFVDSIRNNLDEATCVLALISEAYYASAFCMCELGGVWLASKSFLPVLVPPIDYKDLKAVLGGLQVSKIADEDDLDELRDELLSRLSLDGHATPRWNSKRKTFLSTLPELQKKIEFKGPVTRDKFEKLQAENRSYKEAYEALEAKLEDRDKLISDLKGAKDAKAVVQIVRKHSSVAESFEELVSGAAFALGALSRPVQEALYYRIRKESYRPTGNEEWDDVKRPLEYGQLEVNSEGTLVTLNEKNTKVRKAIAALDELGSWLDEPPEDFYDWYEQDTGGEEPRLALRSFWDRHLTQIAAVRTDHRHDRAPTLQCAPRAGCTH